LALGLLGVGIAWLMMPNRTAGNGQWSGPNRQIEGSIGTTAANAAGEGLRTASDVTRNAASRMREAGRSVRDAVSGGYDRLAHSTGEAATSVKESVSAVQRSVADTATSTGHSLTSAGQSFLNACQEHPLITAGLGLALGAAIGAAFPRTEAEDRLFGETSDDLKGTAQDFAHEQFDAAKQAALQVVEEGKNAVSETAGELSQSHSEPAEPTASRPAGDDSGGESETTGGTVHGQH
jgi:hypothetical protein